MLDIKLIREQPEIIRKDLTKRADAEKQKLLEATILLDKQHRELMQDSQKLRSERNDISKEIATYKKAGKDTAPLMQRAAKIPQEIESIEKKQHVIEEQLNQNLKQLPNILHESVPVGASDAENTTVEVIGQAKQNAHAKSHVDIIELYNQADLARAAKIAGARFWFLKDKLALLDFALQKYAIDFMHKRGFCIVHPPFMMHRDAYEGVTDLKDFEDVMYKIEGEDLYLIATSEHPLTAMFMNEILEEKDLPLKLCGISACFRKEAGAHGKDTKGIFRGHQFNKIEQVVLCKQEESWQWHETILKNAKDFFISLNIPIRIQNICTGDIGTVAAKKYDIEAWMPAQGVYREVVSCSNCTDYQARRLAIRYRTSKGNVLVHTLNSTCVATSRALVAILENFQQNDGSIVIPQVLVPYMNGITKIEKPVE